MPEHDTDAQRAMTRRTWLATTGAMLVTGCAATPAGSGRMAASAGEALDAGRTPGGIDDHLPRWMRLANVPGVSVAIIERDNMIARGYGVTRAEGREAVNADTVFEAASLSKPVFAYLVLRLAAERAIDIDRPLGEYLPLPNPSDAAARSITARRVLSHTTGWRNWRNTREHVLTSEFAPGARFGYSGEGYYFLQRVVERITGRGILRLTRERIFEPLGMRRSAYMSRPDLEVNRAEPHTNRGVPIESFNTRVSRALRASTIAAAKPIDDWTHEDVERGVLSVNKDALVLPNFLLPNVAGSLLTTANDYARFLRHLLGRAGAPAGGRAVLDQMFGPEVSINGALAWGLGFGIQTDDDVGPARRTRTGIALPSRVGPTVFWHWGDSTGVKAFVLGDPAYAKAIVVFTNGNNGRAVYERVIRAVRGEDQAAFLWI